ncbi:MAG: molybdopterin-guanine dinucleotide biosynthesis protein B [Coriobacteriia bacterium]|nr:molybdopterin-guanine dinucleotide biosynthesis protein B [Coriobacteriia bacterium]
MARTYRIPVVSVVGKSDSGKTTLMEGLIRELGARGHLVATVKHHVHEVDVDQPGKDSWRHARAGAATTMISSPSQFVVVRRVEEERSLEQLVDAAGDADILLTEGFKRAGDVRIEVSRRARSDELISAPTELFALVTDNDDLAPAGVPRFALDDHVGIADLIAMTFLQGGR